MTFRDIFKSDFLENVTAVSMTDMCIALALAFALGLLIFLVYKRSYSGVMYSPSFGVTLVALCLITTLLMMAVVSNVVLSLGMVGALSIVRFRAAVKEPMDIAFLFWCIAVGIVLAAGLIPLAVFGSLAVAGVLLVFSRRSSAEGPYILVIHCDAAAETRAHAVAAGAARRIRLKSKSVDAGGVELNYEVRLAPDTSSAFVNALEELAGVHRAILVSYNGDYMG